MLFISAMWLSYLSSMSFVLNSTYVSSISQCYENYFSVSNDVLIINVLKICFNCPIVNVLCPGLIFAVTMMVLSHVEEAWDHYRLHMSKFCLTYREGLRIEAQQSVDKT